MTTRGSWATRLGFILAVAGSAVGLANIWRFPYIVGEYGGAAFIIVYLVCLALIGFPIFIAEILIGRTAQTSPAGAFEKLGKNRIWGGCGKATVLTGFIVSSFYSAVAGWIVGYLFEALSGHLSHFSDAAEAGTYFASLIGHPIWPLLCHLLFQVACVGVLYSGVHKGIERGNKIMMPLFLAALFMLVVKGLTLPNASVGLNFLFSPDWSLLTPTAILAALGHAFFTLSLGQGTMVTYGSYLGRNEGIVQSCFPIALVDLLVSLFAAVAVFTIAFSVGVEPDSGPGLLFQTLPWVFSQIPGGYLVAILFFLLVFLAALTSEISAMEPTIAYLMDERGWSRHRATIACGIGVFLLGVPSALSYGLLKDFTIFGQPFLDALAFLATDVLIPFGGLVAVVMVGWVWGTDESLKQLKYGSSTLFERHPWIETYFKVCFRYCAPALIVLVFLNALGIFG